MTCCSDIAESLLLFRDGNLPPEEMEHLCQHLHMCPPCLCLLNGYDEVVEVLERLKPTNMPDDLRTRMKKCLEEEAGRCSETPKEAPPTPDEGPKP